jgi:O-antigen/teichoic acid export membrane protein
VKMMDLSGPARRVVGAAVPIGLYALAGGVPAVSNFILTPLLVGQLGSTAFATWALVEPLIMLGAAVVCFGVQYGNLNRVSTGLASSGSAFGLALIVIGVTAPAASLFAIPLYVVSFGLATAIWLLACQVLESIAMNITSILRATQRSGAYAIFEGGRYAAVTIAVATIIVLDLTHFRSVDQVLAVKAIATAVSVGLAITFFVPIARPVLTDIRPTLAYGSAIFLGQIVMLFSASADRYVGALSGFDAANMTAYVVHARVAGMLNVLLLTPLGLWFPVEAMKRDVERDGEFFHRISIVVVTGFLLVLVAVQLIVPLSWPIIFPSVPLHLPLLLVLVGVVGAQGLAVIWNIGALRDGHTRWNIVPPFAALLVTFVLGLLLGKLFGAVGVAIGRLVAAVVFAGLFRLISQKIVAGHKPASRLLWFALPGLIILSPTLLSLSNPGVVFAFTGLGLVAMGLAAAASWGYWSPRGRFRAELDG